MISNMGKCTSVNKNKSVLNFFYATEYLQNGERVGLSEITTMIRNFNEFLMLLFLESL